MPFVGLIVGTYDANRDPAESLLRWFHCKAMGAYGYDFPMNLDVTYREYRRGEKEVSYSESEGMTQFISSISSAVTYSTNATLYVSLYGRRRGRGRR